MNEEQFYNGVSVVFAFMPYIGWAFILWLNIADRAATWRAKVTWKKTGVILLGLIGLLALRWDHDMMFYRTYWFEFIRLGFVLALTGALYTRLVDCVGKPGRPKWKNVLIAIVCFIFVFIPMFSFLFNATMPCA